ncbi:DNA recombination protein RmuC [Candidatus Omnitrophota bacterium]
MDLKLVILIVAIFLALIIWGIILLVKMLKNNQPVSASEELLKTLSNIGAVQATLQSVAGEQKDLSRVMKETQRVVDKVKTDYDTRQNFFDKLGDSVETMEQTISGTKRRGEAGENILQDIFKSFPPNMVAKNFRLAGKEVEFALILSNDKVVPIDSKWPAQELIKQLAGEQEQSKRTSLINKIENEINKRVAEVATYIDPARTVPWAVAAVPDAVFAICRKAHLEAYKKGVILVPYCLVLPYLLTLFNLHLQYAGSIDVENLQHYIIDIKRHLEEMEATLENNIFRAAKMISNAANEYKQSLGSIRSSVNNLQTNTANTRETK